MQEAWLFVLTCGQCLPTVAAFFVAPSIKDELQQYGQALLGDASRLECFFKVPPVRSSQREKNASPDTCAVSVANQHWYCCSYEPCKVALTRHVSLGVISLLSGLSGSLGLE